MQAQQIRFTFLLVIITANVPQIVNGQNADRYPTLQPQNTLALLSKTEFIAKTNGQFAQPARFSSENIATNRHLDAGTNRQASKFRENPYYSPAQKCTNCPSEGSSCRPFTIPGLRGQPYCPRQLGGCQCGSIACKYQMSFNSHWPYPMKPSADQYRTPLWIPPGRSDYWDLFNKLGDLHMLPYQRRDNGYTGRNADNYGCLGASCYK